MVEAAKCLRVPTSLTRSKSFIYRPNLAQETVVSIFPRFVDRREGNGKIRQAWMAAKSVLCTIARENHSYSAEGVFRMQTTLARWLIDHDPSATRECFSRLRAGSGCTCNECRNFDAAADR